MNKKQKRNIVILISILVVLILAGIIGFYLWNKEVKKILLTAEQQNQTPKEIFIPLDILTSDEKLSDYLSKNIFPGFISLDESPNKLGLFHIQDYQSGEDFIVATKPTGYYYGAHYFVINKKTGLLNDQADYYCGIDFSSPIYIVSKKPPFFEAECALTNKGSEGNNLFFLSNGELKNLGTFSQTTDDDSRNTEYVTVSVFKDIDDDNNLEIIESGKNSIYADFIGGKLKTVDNILNIYKWDNSKNTFTKLPKTDKSYLSNELVEQPKTSPKIYVLPAAKDINRYSIGISSFDTRVDGYLEIKSEELHGDIVPVPFFVITKFYDNYFQNAIQERINKGNAVNLKENDTYKVNLGCYTDGKIEGYNDTEDLIYITNETQKAILNSSFEKQVSVTLSFKYLHEKGCECCNIADSVRIAN